MNKKNITIIIIVSLLIMVAFWYMGNSGTSSTADTSLTTTQTSSESADAQYIYSLLQQMNQVKLQDTIFSAPAFLGLKDNTVSFSSLPAGRNNPFAPLGSTGNAVPASTTIKVSIK